MSSTFVQLPLVRMVDLCISPTEGIVNFHLLQATLYALIQKSNAQTIAVEIHGAEAAKLQEQLKATPEKPPYVIKETVDKSAQGKDQQVYVLQTENAYVGNSSVAKEKLDTLEEEMNDIKQQIIELRDLPGNLGIIDAVKNYEEKTSTVIDVFHMLSLQKRLEASEEGMVKMASIVEDLIKSPAIADGKVVCTKEDAAEQDGQKLDAKASNVSTRRSSRTFTDTEMDAKIRKLMKDVEDIQIRLKLKKQRSQDTISGGLGEEEEKHDIEETDGSLTGLSEERLKEIAEHVERLDLQLKDGITRLHNQFTDIEKDFNELLNKIEQRGANDDGEAKECCGVLQEKITQLENDFADINETSAKLLGDKEEKTRVLDFLVEQIEALKTGKADREEIEEALAEKADACAVQRKVSHDQFDNACEELSKGVGEALDKLSQQEQLWEHALDDLQNEIGNKLDKIDLEPLREFINNKLRVLQDKMKSLAALKREQEAAGTKNKILRDVTCLSCDKDVVMYKEYDVSKKPLSAVVPPSRSMAPYLAYELDSLRKQQKSVKGGKNLHSFEAAMAGRQQKKAADHICNRYCGGSHTITTPHQRVTRLGHFLMQWGPEAQPIFPTDKKSTPNQKLSVEHAELTSASLRMSSKMDQTKRPSKLSQIRESKTSTGDEPKRLSQEQQKRKQSAGSVAEKKMSAISNEGSGIYVKDSKRSSKSKQETIPEDIEPNSASEDGQGKPPLDAEEPTEPASVPEKDDVEPTKEKSDTPLQTVESVEPEAGDA